MLRMVCRGGHALLVAMLVLAGCSRSGFDQPGDQAIDARRDWGDDLARDRGSIDSSPDLTQDGPGSRRLSCGSSTPVGTFPQPSTLTEPAITPDGLHLHAHKNTTYHLTSRASFDAPFGNWTSATSFWPTTPEQQDPTFFVHEGGLRALTAVTTTGSQRRLRYCPLDGSACTPLTVFDQVTGDSLDFDLDGPSINDAFELLISVASSSSLAAIYRATPRDAKTLTEWDAAPLLVAPGKVLDDAAITRDGSLIVVIDTAPDPTRLYYTFRDAQGAFGPLQPIAIGADDPSSPEVFRRPDGAIEIYYREKSAPQLVQLTCQ